jgi:hypothetical protein
MGGGMSGGTRVANGVFHGFWGFLLCSVPLSSVSVCRERGFRAMNALKALTIQSMRFVLILILDCFISLKKEKEAFLIFDGG